MNRPTALVAITHINWRGGRPRFVPGPRLRRLGYRGRDLRHPTGQWFTFEESVAESRRISAEAETLAGQGRPVRRPTAPGLGPTLGALAASIFDRPEFQGRDIVDGKRHRKALTAKTVKGYEYAARAAEKACTRLAGTDRPNLWDLPVVALTADLMQTILHEVERQSGLATARLTRAFLSTVWTREARRLPGVNTSLFDELERMPTLPGRIRAVEPADLLLLVQVADAMGRPEVGDMLIYGALHGQRQIDRFKVTVEAETETHITVTQGKRGKVVTLLKPPLLAARLAAARTRRKGHTVQWPHLFIDEKAGRPWHESGDHYRRVFASIRAEAACHQPALADIRDQDLRDTNQTWLDRAGTDPAVIAYVAGHSPSSYRELQKRHYVAPNQQRAEAAVDLLNAYLVTAMPTPAREQEG